MPNVSLPAAKGISAPGRRQRRRSRPFEKSGRAGGIPVLDRLAESNASVRGERGGLRSGRRLEIGIRTRLREFRGSIRDDPQHIRIDGL